MLIGDDNIRLHNEGLTVCRATLALAVIAVIIAGKNWLVYVNGICHCFAETMAGQSHLEADGIGQVNQR